MPTQLFERSRRGEHALLIQPHAGGPPAEGVLEEFGELARSAGATVAAVLTAKIDRPNPATLIGIAKLQVEQDQIEVAALRQHRPALGGGLDGDRLDAMVDLQDDALHRRQDQRMVIDQQHFHRQTPRAPQACPDPMVAPGGASPHLAGSPPKEESQPSTS